MKCRCVHGTCCLRRRPGRLAMAELSPEERARVGLPPDVPIEQVEHRSAPSSHVGQAFSGEKSLAEVLELLPLEPDFDPVFRDARLGDVQRWLGASGVYRLPWSADVADGDCDVGGERPIVDARRRPALVRLHVGGDVFIVRLAAEGASLFRALLEPRHRIEAPPDPPEIVVPTPDLASLLHGREAPTWLRKAFEELASSPYPPSRVAAVGLVVRGWGPRTKEERAQESARMLEGDGGIVAHGRRWVQELDAKVREHVERRAMEEAEALPDRLCALGVGGEGGRSALGWVVAALVRARDELASVSVALELVGEGMQLRRTLENVDDELLAHGTLILDATQDIRDHLGVERLEALARLDLGESWWLCPR